MITFPKNVREMPDGLYAPNLPIVKTDYQKWKEEAEAMWKLVKPYLSGEEMFVDAGAYIGLMSRLLSLHFYTGIAFEPVPINFLCLLHNMAYGRKNTDNNVDLIQTALSDNRTPVDLYLNAAGMGTIHEKKTFSHQVIPSTLDSFHVKDVNFIKIDTDGMEVPVLRGAEKTINTYHPVLWVETFHSKGPINTLLATWDYIPIHDIHKDTLYIWGE